MPLYKAHCMMMIVFLLLSPKHANNNCQQQSFYYCLYFVYPSLVFYLQLSVVIVPTGCKCNLLGFVDNEVLRPLYSISLLVLAKLSNFFTNLDFHHLILSST